MLPFVYKLPCQPRPKSIRKEAYSIGTRSEIIIAPRVIMPPAPNPHRALAAMKVPILVARAHQAVAAAKRAIVPTNSLFRPSESEMRPTRGWKAVEVRRKDVDSHEALLLAWK